jgi:Photosynthesis affected mutant 68
MSSEPPRQRLPFEPIANRKKTPKKPAETPENLVHKQPAAKNTGGTQSQSIPEAVSKRMISRIALFCGVPTLLGISTFFVSYLIVTKGLFDLPNTAVLLVSMGCFGLGVLGLSYGVLSASWDEEVSGSPLGWEEFTTNFGRMREGWRNAKSKG